MAGILNKVYLPWIGKEVAGLIFSQDSRMPRVHFSDVCPETKWIMNPKSPDKIDLMNPFEVWILSIQYPLTLSLPECLMEFCKVTLTFDSVDKILWCNHWNESSLPVLTHGAICFSNFYKMKWGNLVEICFRLNLAVKGLRGQCACCLGKMMVICEGNKSSGKGIHI